MNSAHRVLLVGVTVAILASCTHLPRSPKQTEATENIRAQYFQDHPDGRFNDHIMRGELVKGMSVVEVLASWGIPDRRQSSDRVSETWVYNAQDEFSKDYVSYALVFEERLLSRWAVGRSTAAGRNLPLAGLEGSVQEPVLQPPRGAAFRSGKAIPRK